MRFAEHQEAARWGVTKWGIKNASASADALAVLEVKPSTGICWEKLRFVDFCCFVCYAPFCYTPFCGMARTACKTSKAKTLPEQRPVCNPHFSCNSNDTERLRFVCPRCPQETDGMLAKLVQCGIASEAPRRNEPLGSYYAVIDLIMGLFRGAVFSMAGCPEDTPLTLMGRVPQSLNGTFSPSKIPWKTAH